jgi:hypothetical protein
MRAPFTFVAFLALGPLGCAAVREPAHVLPSGSWSLKVCAAFGPSNDTPCIYLTQKLILRVENPTWPPPPQRKVVFEQAISPALAQQVYAHALSAIRSVGDVQGQWVQDGTDVRITLTVHATSAEAHFMSAGIDQAGPEVSALIRLLRDTTHAF